MFFQVFYHYFMFKMWTESALFVKVFLYGTLNCVFAMMQIENYVNTVHMYTTVIACILAHFSTVLYKLYKATLL
jgi:hypothetical protein